MNETKIKKLETYLYYLNNQLNSATPKKHIDNPATYKAYLLNEVRLHNAKLTQLKGI